MPLRLLPLILLVAACAPTASVRESLTPAQRAEAIAALTTVQQVFQHPRCQNCHIPGDAPLQFDEGRPHAMGVQRGAAGHGAPGLPCATCHAEHNPPPSYGANAPPGAPHWALPPPHMKMAWYGLPPQELCQMIQDRAHNGDRDFPALLKHVSEDQLVLWGWAPGGTRAPVSVPHEQFVAAFKTWAAAGGPCPDDMTTAGR